MNGKQILKSALHAGDWFVNTQNKDSESGDLGRFIYALKLETKEYWLSSGWQTAFGVFALLSLHNATKDDKYLQAALTHNVDHVVIFKRLEHPCKLIVKRTDTHQCQEKITLPKIGGRAYRPFVRRFK